MIRRGNDRIKDPHRVLSPPTRVAVILTLVSNVMLFSAGEALALTVGDCDDYSQYTNGYQIGREVRDSTNYPGYDAVKAYVIGADLKSCYNPNIPVTLGQLSAAFVNLDWTGGILQLGYGRSDCPSGYSCALPDNTLAWFYTPADNTSGTLDDWSGITQPIVGHTYLLSISLISGPSWKLGIYDYNTAVQVYKTISAHTSSMRAAFWMYEVHNRGDQLGSNSGNSPSILQDLEYSPINQSTWNRVTLSADAPCLSYPGVWSSWHHCNRVSVAGYGALEAWTANHP